jgi:deoxyadenosine/deoxycytidine kinase
MEQNTSVDYWQEMYNRYEDWINNFTACPVIRININEYDVVQDKDSIHMVLEKISQRLGQTNRRTKTVGSSL